MPLALHICWQCALLCSCAVPCPAVLAVMCCAVPKKLCCEAILALQRINEHCWRQVLLLTSPYSSSMFVLRCALTPPFSPALPFVPQKLCSEELVTLQRIGKHWRQILPLTSSFSSS